MRRALARGDSSAWLNAQLAGERAVIPLAARTINRDAVSGRESSSALTLKDTCAETVNVSVTDGLASDTSVTTALTRNTTRPGIQGGRQDLAAGAPGRVIISWTCPTATISYSASTFCKSITSATANITGTTGGTFSATPAGLSINSTTGEINPSTSTAGTYTVHYQIASGGNGCTAVDATFSVTIGNIPLAAVTNQTNITCFAANDGTITVSASGGTSPYTFSVDNGTNYLPATGTNLRLFTGLLPNIAYRIKVKDNNGCVSK